MPMKIRLFDGKVLSGFFWSGGKVRPLLTAEQARMYRRRRLAYLLRLMLTYAYHILGFRYHWTLTLAEEVPHRDFLRAMRRLYNYVIRRGGSVIYVKERQKRGVVHVHFVTNLYLDHSEVEKIWRLGFVWVSEIKDESQLSYLVKYLTKSLLDFGRYARVWGVWNIKRSEVKLDGSVEEAISFLLDAAVKYGLRFEAFSDGENFFIRFAFDPYTYEDLCSFEWFRESYRANLLDYLIWALS